MPTRVMAINSSREILELYHLLLTDEGYEAFVFSFGPDDLEEVKRVKPDILILDQPAGMIRITWDLLQKLKMERTTAHIPIVLCTTQHRIALDMEGFFATKRITVVLKPFDIDELLRAVKTAEALTDIIEPPEEASINEESNKDKTAKA
jgi:DNA-binding response OmpR family regulator